MNEPIWQDYHKHTSLSNVYTKDSPLIHLDYWNELKTRYGDKPCTYTTVEHGWAGNYFKTYDDLEKFNKKNGTNIKFVFGYEAYWVKDRHTDDKSNCHMILLAKNDNGRKALNKILSIANKDGYYYRPRLDLELIMSLPPDDVMLTTACFERGTQILTQEGYKNIEDVHRGDVVLSHDGKWNKVIAPTHREYNGKMCNIKFEGCFENIKCTEDHLFPTVEKKHGRVTDVIVWKHAKDLSLNDRVLDAIDEQQENVDFIYVDEILAELRKDTVFLSKRKNKINIDKMPIDNLLLTTMGLFVAEGNYGTDDYNLSFTFHKKETHLIDIVNQFSEKYLSKQVHIQRKKNSKAVTITINGKEICLLFKNFINGGAENKNVPPFIKKLPPYKQMYFLKGLFLGDGCFTKKGRVTFVTISKSLAYDTRDILERNGIKCGCRTIASKIDKNGVNHRTSYAIDVYGEDLCKYFNEFVNSNNKWEFNFSKRNSSKEVKEIDGVKYLVKRIRGKEEYHYNGTVFCLNVENAHSFRVDGVNVHNCIAYWNKYQDIDDITAQLASKFPHFYLEVQPHHTQQQADLNRHILELSCQLNVPIIAGCDSHVIFESQMKDRDDLLESAHISYEDEVGWFMDFPTYDVLVSRFQKQGVLSDEQIKQAIDNTNVLMDFEDIILDRSLKVPVVKSLKDKTQQERNKEFERIVWDEWERQKWDINEAKHDEYIKEINDAINEIESCNMGDYFILSYYVMKDGQEKYGGILTPTGRGSAVGMYINKLLRLTKVDKVNSSVEMYPERFLTKERVLESHTPPDVDNNVSSRNEFIQAQKDLIGELGTYDLLALGTLKAKAAWKMYARANGIDPQVANKVSYQIGDYEQAKKHADNPDDVNIEDFIAPEFKELFEGCKRYLGIYDNRKAHPCGCLAYSGDAEADIGVILCKSEATGNEVLTAVIESGTIDAFGYLKQDYLIVDSIGLTYDIYKEIGIEPYTVNQLLDKIKTDDATWNIYRDGYTQCVNQCEQPKSTQKVMRYKPKNISELTQFIAGIRPGFQSMYHLFESRQHFEYGIKALDDLIQDEYRTSSFIIYQEDLMKVLEFAGFPMAETYTIIKAISKKKDYVIKEAKPKFTSGFAKAIIDTGETDDENVANDLAEKVWHIVEDNCAYGFNCVSGDTIMYKPGWNKQHPLLTVEEMYKVMHDKEYAVATGHKNLHDKYKRYGYGFGLSMKDGVIVKNKIVDIYKQPQTMTYLIRTEQGREIKATENHKFPTINGIKQLNELQIGDILYAKGEYKQAKYNTRLTSSFEPNFPSKGQCGFQKRPDGDSVVFERCKEQHEANHDCCEICNRPYGEMRFELHHIDFDRTHNEESNYQWLCCSCHKKIHYKNGRTKVFEKGIPVQEDRIVSIEPAAIETIYDIEMSGDVAHNFVLANGLVTCNSAHAYCMAIDSVTIAYLKAHYPLEFYKCVLQRFSNKGEKDKVSLIKQEAIKRGIAIKEIKFGDDNREFNIDHEHNAIVQNMAGIKNMPKATPEALYELGQYGIRTRTQLYQALIDDSRINVKAIDILFKLNYFSAFAHPNRLLAEFEIYSKYIDSKVVSKKNLTDEQTELLRSIGAKETATQFRNFDSMELIKTIIKSTPIPKTSIYQRIKWQIEFLGYSTLNDPSIDPSYWIVVDVESGAYNRKDATLYNICYGVTRQYRINKKFNQSHEINPLTLIQAVVHEKPRMKKNEDGSFSVVPNEFVKEVKCWKEFEIK